MAKFTIEKPASHSYSLPESFVSSCGLPDVSLRVLDVIYAHSFHPRAVAFGGLTSVPIRVMSIEGGFGGDSKADAVVRTELNRLKAFGLITEVYRPDPAEQFIERKGTTITLSNLYRLNTDKILTCIDRLNMVAFIEEIYDNETFFSSRVRVTITDPYDKAVFRISYAKDYKGAETIHELYLLFQSLIGRKYKKDLIQAEMWKALRGKPIDIARVASSWVKALDD
jgi:hypothetical protein